MRILKSRPGRKRPPGPSARDLGLVHYGAGKGDTARNCHSEEYRTNFDEINWGTKDEPRPAKGGKTVKVYGAKP